MANEFIVALTDDNGIVIKSCQDKGARKRKVKLDEVHPHHSQSKANGRSPVH